jgi:hypothetical protein
MMAVTPGYATSYMPTTLVHNKWNSCLLGARKLILAVEQPETVGELALTCRESCLGIVNRTMGAGRVAPLALNVDGPCGSSNEAAGDCDRKITAKTILY